MPVLDYIQIGKLVATHGIKGDLIAEHVLGGNIRAKSLAALKALFVEEAKGSYIPYFIEKATVKTSTELLIKLEGLDSKEQSKRLVRRNIWLTQSDFSSLADKTAPIGLIGFMVYNEEDPLSEVLEVIEQPHQILLRIEYQQKEVLIPLHGETLDEIDRAGKRIYVTLPDGLLELYLEG